MARTSFHQSIEAVGVQREEERRKRERAAKAASALADDLSTRFAKLREAVHEVNFVPIAEGPDLAQACDFEIDAIDARGIHLEVAGIRGGEGVKRQPKARSYFLIDADPVSKLVTYMAVVAGDEGKSSHGPVGEMPDWLDLKDKIAAFVESIPAT